MHLRVREHENPEPVRAEEQRLISGVLAKDRKATAEFVALCADCVYPFICRRLMPDTQFVEDMLQDVLLAAWQNLPNFRGDSGLRSWFLGIARHKIEDYYRKRIHEADLAEDGPDAEEPAVLPALEEHLDGDAQHKRVQSVLAELPEAYRVALLWRYRDERSTRDMALISGKTEKGIERLLARAREAFRKRWNHVRP